LISIWFKDLMVLMHLGIN